MRIRLCGIDADVLYLVTHCELLLRRRVFIFSNDSQGLVYRSLASNHLGMLVKNELGCSLHFLNQYLGDGTSKVGF